MIKNMLVIFPFSDDNKARLRAALPETEITFTTHSGYTDDELGRAEVILGNIDVAALSKAANLKWLHLCSAGTDGYIPAAEKGIMLTNGTGAYDVVLPEHMLALLFSLNMLLPGYREDQKAHIWKRLGWSEYIYGSTCLMLGAGNIGLGFLRRAKALGAYTIGVRRSGTSKPDYVDEMYGMDAIDTLLPRADYVVMALPGTPETTNIMDARRIALMKPGAKLINCGRGNAVDAEALAAALREGRLSGAGLDVTYKEPLPVDSFLWDVPNLIITPHVAGSWNVFNDTTSPFMEKTVFDVFAANLEDYLAGRPLRNRVDLKTGYRETQK
jgi:phosphoglycerate dehydrogenase-like enzyme